MTGRLQTGLAAATLLWAATAAVGCSLLVDPGQGAHACVVNDAGDDPCPSGLLCKAGRCQDIEPTPDATPREDVIVSVCDGSNPTDDVENCNGIDDNCDGVIDEGHDLDNDQANWCGGGKRSQADCDDQDPTTYPGAPEACDGRDNDCDGKVDEGMNLCPAGEQCLEQRCIEPNCLNASATNPCPDGTRCDPSGECVEGAGCTVDSCEADEICDIDSGTCVGQAKQNGTPCADHSECGSGACIDVAALRMDMNNERVCGSACCSDEDCKSEEFCFASGSGARSCLPKTLDPRGDSPAPTCSMREHCPGSPECLLGTQRVASPDFENRDDVLGPICEEPTGTSNVGRTCTDPSDCESGVCERFNFFLSVCSGPCGESSDCQGVFGGSDSYCRYQARENPSGATDFVPICVLARTEQLGTGTQGASCTAPSDCDDGACVGAAGGEGQCADACCSDAQCQGSELHCRPVAFGDGYEMRCVP